MRARNRIPLSPGVVGRIVKRLDPHRYDRLYTLNGDTVDHEVKTAVHRAAEPYLSGVRGDHDADT